MKYVYRNRKGNPMKRPAIRMLAALLLVLSAAASAEADTSPYRLFPSLYMRSSQLYLPQTVARMSPAGNQDRLAERIPLLANTTVVSFYGHPSSKKMGIHGLYSKEEIADMLTVWTRRYDEANGTDGAMAAYYLIYGTCWPGGEIGYMKESMLEDYIIYAQSRGMLVFVDHQIGKYSVSQAMDRILPFLRYPNVHLAIDPEWRTLTPMKEIGSITADELNQAQKQMQDYIVANNIPGIRMLVVHQFHEKMISSRERVKADFDQVLLVHTADGFGSPALKRSTYSMNSRAENMPVKGFKLFFKSDFPLAGWDNPLLSPAEVMALDPRPGLIIYQ